MKIETHTYLELLKPVIWHASDEIMKIYQNKDVHVFEKEDKSPLTIADMASHEIISRALKLMTPDIPVISEENKSQIEVREEPYYWVVDPLDGTKEFVAGNGEFTINVALVKNGEPILALVMAPVANELYFANKNSGSYVQNIEGRIQKIKAATFKENSTGLTVLCSRSHLDPTTKSYLQNMLDPEIIKKGGSMKFMDIASGRAHVYPRFGPTMEWDTCAPQLIVEESGGALIDQTTHQPLRYGKSGFLNNHFIVYGQRV